MIRRTLATLALAGLLALAGCTIPDTSTGSKPLGEGTAATDQTSTQPGAYTPTAKDFRLKVKTLRKQCFGEAGCNLTYRIQVAYGGQPLDKDATYEVTYEVRGVQDGPAVNTFTVEGGGYRVEEEETASTRSVATKLTAVVTSVEAA